MKTQYGTTTSRVMSRKERQRDATLREIRQIARELLVADGNAAVTINAIARRMGMSGPALYRYYDSQAALIAALRTEFYLELIGAMRAAAELEPANMPDRRLLAICRALRGWAAANPTEFGWLFTRPAGAANPEETLAASCETGQAFGRVFLDQVVEIWEAKRFPIPSLEDMPPSIAVQLRAYSDRIGGRLPPEASYVFLGCWMRLYGLLCMEVFRQIAFAYTDMEPVFEECLQELCGLLEIPYRAPAA